MTSSFVSLPRAAALSAVIVALMSCLPRAAVDVTAQPRRIPPFDGVWKLNVEASVNPNGPAVPERGWRETDSFDASSLIDEAGARARADALVRFDAMTTLFFTAPPTVGVSATATEFTLVLDPTNRLGYVHRTDNKAQPLVTSAGPAEFKVRWDGNKIRRELRTKNALHITEEYMLSSDSKQLIVTVKADSRMVSMKKVEIRRVYDRAIVP